MENQIMCADSELMVAIDNIVNAMTIKINQIKNRIQQLCQDSETAQFVTAFLKYPNAAPQSTVTNDKYDGISFDDHSSPDELEDFLNLITPVDGKLNLTIAAKDTIIDEYDEEIGTGSSLLKRPFSLCIRQRRDKEELRATVEDLVLLLQLIAHVDCMGDDVEDEVLIDDEQYLKRKEELMNKFGISKRYRWRRCVRK